MQLYSLFVITNEALGATPNLLEELNVVHNSLLSHKSVLIYFSLIVRDRIILIGKLNYKMFAWEWCL